MPAKFIGFNTINQYKKFKLTDNELVKRDFVNALNINKGEMPGVPDYGTTLWSFIFTNYTPEVEKAMRNEIMRVAAQDPRLFIDDIEFYSFNNGLRIELTIRIVPGTEAEQLAIFFDQQARRAEMTF